MGHKRRGRGKAQCNVFGLLAAGIRAFGAQQRQQVPVQAMGAAFGKQPVDFKNLLLPAGLLFGGVGHGVPRLVELRSQFTLRYFGFG
ncbi:hypothetical protein MBH78_18970 [Oceanimonas sp. NS1]|nr:hypothetical protein [Oceanimonas sp. NS1]